MDDEDLTPEEEDELRHYASKYYDPIKAREYYLRTRKLKGRKSGSGEKPLTGEQRDAWNYTKTKINEAEKKEVEKNRTANQKKIDDLRKKASDTRDRIRDKIQKALEDLSTDLQSESNKIQTKREEDLKNKINKIPSNASPGRRAFLEKQNARIRDSINKSADSKLKDLRLKARNTSIDKREETRLSLKDIGPDLKVALEDTRMAYEKKVADTAAKYDKVRDTELAGIRKNVKNKK